MTRLRWATLVLLALAASPRAAEPAVTIGEVESVQSLDASQLGGGDYRVLVLDDGRGFRLPGRGKIAVGSGVRVEVEYLPREGGGEMPRACAVRVLAVPLDDGMREAARPFEVYRNESSQSGC